MVSQQKIIYVNNLYDYLSKSDTIIIANTQGIPASALQEIRKALKKEGYYIKFVRKRLLIKALERFNDENIKKIVDMIKANKSLATMILIPKEDINPFDLYTFLEKNKSYRAAKIGDVLSDDVVIRAGPTNFTPGPILTELKAFGLKTKVEGGKIVIEEDKVVAKKGDVVNDKLLSLLQKFGIKPIPVKLEIFVVYKKKKGIIYTYDVLSVPLSLYVDQIYSGFKKSLSLSLQIGYPTKENIKILLSRAYIRSKNLSLEVGLITEDNAKELLIRGFRAGEKLRGLLNI